MKAILDLIGRGPASKKKTRPSFLSSHPCVWTSALLHRPNLCFLHAPKRPPNLFTIRLQGEASAAVMATGNRSWITTGCCSATRCRLVPTCNHPLTLCHSLLPPPPPPSPGNGEGRSICIQTEAAPSPLLKHSSPPPPLACAVTVACHCNLISLDECSTLISSIWRGRVTRSLFVPGLLTYRRARCIGRIQKVVRGHMGRRLFVYLHR